MALHLERLSEKHMREVDDFYCGIQYNSLAHFLKNESFRYNDIGEGNTYILKSDKKEKEHEIIAYYTLRCNSIQMENPDYKGKNLNDSRKYLVVPTLEISRFAVNEEYQNKGLGQTILLNYIFPHIVYLRKLVGIQAILVLSLNDTRTKHVYDNVGFKEMKKQLQTLIEYENEECISMIINLEESENEEKLLEFVKKSYGIEDIKKLVN